MPNPNSQPRRRGRRGEGAKGRKGSFPFRPVALSPCRLCRPFPRPPFAFSLLSALPLFRVRIHNAARYSSSLISGSAQRVRLGVLCVSCWMHEPASNADTAETLSTRRRSGPPSVMQRNRLVPTASVAHEDECAPSVKSVHPHSDEPNCNRTDTYRSRRSCPR